MRINDEMLRNALEPLFYSGSLRHVILLQIAKGYGVHVRRSLVPAREGRDEARDIPNFYWIQQDWLEARAAESDWHWTVLRPPLIVGYSIGVGHERH